MADATRDPAVGEERKTRSEREIVEDFLDFFFRRTKHYSEAFGDDEWNATLDRVQKTMKTHLDVWEVFGNAD